MKWISYGINLILTWSISCAICKTERETTFPITDIKLYVLVVTLSTKSNTKLSQKLKPGFKHTIYWNNYQSRFNKGPNLKEFLVLTLIKSSVSTISYFFSISLRPVYLASLVHVLCVTFQTYHDIRKLFILDWKSFFFSTSI